jgi:peptide/nickel transport system substrate-binding protein
MTTSLVRSTFVALLTAAVVAGCAPSQSREANGPQRQAVEGRSKTLILGQTTEPTDLAEFAVQSTRGNSTVITIAHQGLSATTESEARIAMLATEVPKIEDGTWRIHADGTMETTWKIRPNAKWQDGTPLTSADLVFTLQVYQDPEIPPRRDTKGVPFISSAATPDASTLVLQWSQPFELADGEFGRILPKHLLEEAYRTDKQGFITNRYFQEDFVGLGPYRLVRWEAGSHLEFERFADYYAGRPPLDRVILKVISDPNTLIANVLSGAIDVALPPSVGQDVLEDVKQRWQGTGNQATAESSGRMRVLDPQHRLEYARPQFATTVTEVRQALYHALDRQSMADILTSGIAPAADSWLPPDYWLRRDVESSIPKFPLDLNRAQQLLAQAGWTKSADGTLIHSQTGERFDIVVRLATAQGASAGKEKEAAIIRDNWKPLGIETIIEPIPAARAGDRQYEATVPGFSLTGNLAPRGFWTSRTDSRIIASDADRWAGGNKAGYSNPRVDQLIDALKATIEPAKQIPLHRELLQVQMGDVAVMPLYWEQVPIFWLKEVKGPIGDRTGYRFFEWDKE